MEFDLIIYFINLWDVSVNANVRKVYNKNCVLRYVKLTHFISFRKLEIMRILN